LAEGVNTGKIFKENDMKRIGVLILVILFSFGTVALMSGCLDGDGDGDGNGDVDPVDTTLPTSTPSYAGSGDAAFLDTTIALEAIALPSLLASFAEFLMDANPLEVIWDTTDTIAGADTGFVTSWYYQYESESDTLDTYREIWELVFEDYADSAGSFYGITAADGTIWQEYREEEMYDGGEVAPAGTGTLIGDYMLGHVDYDSFSFATSVENVEISGYMTMTEENDYSVGATPDWEYNYMSDIAMAAYPDTTYIGMLGADSTLAWNGSVTSWVAVGTLCLDGVGADPFGGCFDFDLDIFWAENSEGDFPTTMPPDGGMMEISSSAYGETAISASALYAFDSSPSTPGCFELSVDLNGDGDYIDKGEWDAVEFCP
jgi:hypothetical protein